MVEDENTVTVKVGGARVSLLSTTCLPVGKFSGMRCICALIGCLAYLSRCFLAHTHAPLCVPVQDIVYTKLECVGRGGSSKVYKVMAPNRKIFALKRIRLQVGRFEPEGALG